MVHCVVAVRMLQQNQQAIKEDSIATCNRMQSKYIQPNITQVLARCSIQVLGSPQCRNLINTNQNNDHALIPNRINSQR